MKNSKNKMNWKGLILFLFSIAILFIGAKYDLAQERYSGILILFMLPVHFSLFRAPFNLFKKYKKIFFGYFAFSVLFYLSFFLIYNLILPKGIALLSGTLIVTFTLGLIISTLFSDRIKTQEKQEKEKAEKEKQEKLNKEIWKLLFQIRKKALFLLRKIHTRKYFDISFTEFQKIKTELIYLSAHKFIFVERMPKDSWHCFVSCENNRRLTKRADYDKFMDIFSGGENVSDEVVEEYSLKLFK